ncbi:MAG: PTS sugar transporter subunit IIA [Phycisphaerae bacterium]|nr:PTS sugar transporter subunit IIA [Phycisphaerae bacterium]
MPHEKMDAQQVAAYVHLDLREVRKLASRGQMPARKVGERFIFTKAEVDRWVEREIHELDADRLERIERGVRAHHGMAAGELEVAALIPDGGVEVPLGARTCDAAIRRLVALGEACGCVYAPDDVIEDVRGREDLHSTAVAPGVALPHPPGPLPYDISESFVVCGLSPAGIPFGAPDGSLTHLFALVCCKEERTQLHVLARLARMVRHAPTRRQLLAAAGAEALRAILHDRERALIDDS